MSEKLNIKLNRKIILFEFNNKYTTNKMSPPEPISDFTNDVISYNTISRFQIDDYIINTTYLTQDTYQITSIRPIRDRITDVIIGHLYFSKPIGRDAECIFGIFPHDPYDWVLYQQV